MSKPTSIPLTTSGSYVVPSRGAYVDVVGSRPKSRPYVWIGTDGGLYGTIDDPRKLRALARRILRALGDKP